MGGVETDEWARTSLVGLFAAGEVACTGVHGANRLASNSLLEGLVFGARAAEAMQQTASAGRLKGDRRRIQFAEPDPAPWNGEAHDDIAAVRDLMWRAAGLFRGRDGLLDAVARLTRDSVAHEAQVRATPSDGEAWRRFNLVTIARLIARAALRREESRGSHFRTDFPARDDEHWRFHVVDVRGAD
jgi:L-aspartate oxidase